MLKVQPLYHLDGNGRRILSFWAPAAIVALLLPHGTDMVVSNAIAIMMAQAVEWVAVEHDRRAAVTFGQVRGSRNDSLKLQFSHLHCALKLYPERHPQPMLQKTPTHFVTFVTNW